MRKLPESQNLWRNALARRFERAATARRGRSFFARCLDWALCAVVVRLFIFVVTGK